MTQYYLDTVGGNDASDGLTWATRWKSFAHAGAVMVAGDALSETDPQQYCSLSDLKNRLWPAGTTPDTLDDTALASIVTAISRAIDGYTGRRFYAATETRYYTPVYSDLIFVDDLLSITSIQLDYAATRVYDITLATTDYDLEPINAPLESVPQPYTMIRRRWMSAYVFVPYRHSVKIVGSFGFCSSTPPQVKEATLLITEKLKLRAGAPFGIVGTSTLGGQIKEIMFDNDAELKILLAPPISRLT